MAEKNWLKIAHDVANHYRLKIGLKMIYSTILEIAAVLAAIWVIYDVITYNKRLSDGMRVLWIILALILSIVTAIVYYFIGRDAKNDLFAQKSQCI